MKSFPLTEYTTDFLNLVKDFTLEALANQHRRYDTPDTALYAVLAAAMRVMRLAMNLIADLNLTLNLTLELIVNVKIEFEIDFDV